MPNDTLAPAGGALQISAAGTAWLGRAAQPDRLDLSTERGDAFRTWKERWEDFYLLAGIGAMEPRAQMAALRACLTDDTNRVVRNLPLEEDERQDVHAVLRQLEVYAIGQVNEVLERKRSQEAAHRDATEIRRPDVVARIGDPSHEDDGREPQPSATCRVSNGTTLRSVGVLHAVITLDDASAEEEVHILPGVSGLLMSWRDEVGEDGSVAQVCTVINAELDATDTDVRLDEVLSVGNLASPNVEYEYTVSVERAETYQWQLSPHWSACDRVCQGTRYREAQCVRRSDSVSVSESHCSREPRSDREEVACNLGCTLM
ncbi:A disintegrin and metalloproteinase with thrombospondin motifs 20 [Amphibalanus amphitrite]|uniref:A disintegrin and metalloproteinase with thrombospondin motifs 20 n=1 Tax=Amphibalanus amphitrite TaxID=1232801 RepID=A0A6A4V9X0_AMPAM|nr:A disintegrin and metalloproteinase with thrombospondin motifs 20 [Amphibalanus amphitrite]